MMTLGCSAQAPYMRGWDVVQGTNHRWTGGTFKEQKLSPDEAAVYQQLGTPEIIRFFRELHTRQHVYEWLYEAKDEAVWFVDGTRVEYVAVDPNTSGLTKATRETMQEKAVTGGLLSTVVGGFAAGFLLLGDSLGLKD
jgi:hypothetical protein